MNEEYMNHEPDFSTNDKVNDKDYNFLQWFLSLESSIIQIKLSWRGWELDDHGRWVKTANSDNFRVMNELGINWGVSLMHSYLNKISQATNWDEHHMNFQMRVCARVVWHTLSVRYKEFNLTKTNAKVVGDTIFYQIHAILLSARGEGIRKFIQTTQSVSEHRILNQNQENQGGVFAGMRGMFGGRG